MDYLRNSASQQIWGVKPTSCSFLISLLAVFYFTITAHTAWVNLGLGNKQVSLYDILTANYFELLHRVWLFVVDYVSDKNPINANSFPNVFSFTQQNLENLEFCFPEQEARSKPVMSLLDALIHYAHTLIHTLCPFLGCLMNPLSAAWIPLWPIHNSAQKDRKRERQGAHDTEAVKRTTK